MSEPTNFPYIHGFSKEEQDRLRTQAQYAEYSVYKDVNFSEAKRVIEIGCGIGAQSEILLRRFPNLELVSVDLNDKQLDAAKKTFKDNKRIQFHKMDAQDLKLEERFDGAFICWLLEHVPEPQKVLMEARRVLKPAAKIYVTEVMNFNFFLDPYSPNIWKYWMAMNDFQYENAGDPFVGAKLGNLLQKAGFGDIQTKVITWHYDNRFPDHRRKHILFWKDLMLSGADRLIKEGIITQEIVDNCEKEFDNVVKNPDAVFYDAFMQAEAKVY